MPEISEGNFALQPSSAEINSLVPRFLHGDIAVEKFSDALAKKTTDGPQHRQEVTTVQELFDTFFQTELQNTALFRDAEGNVFPYTTINVTDVARQLYAKAGKELPAQNPDDKRIPKIKKQVVFGSFPQVQNGHPFTFVETAMRRYMDGLQSVLGDLEKGEVPDDLEIITLGAPSNWYGEITPQLIEKIRTDGMDAYADVYAPLIKDILPKSAQDQARTSIVFDGLSMGGSLAAVTASKLLSEGVVWQPQEVKPGERTIGQPHEKPMLHVLVTNPAGVHKGDKTKQMYLGLMGEGIVRGIFDKHLRASALGEGKFLESLEPVLRQNGIVKHMSKEEAALKQEAVSLTNQAMYRGMDVPANVQVTAVQAQFDPLAFSYEFYRQAKEHRGVDSTKMPLSEFAKSHPDHLKWTEKHPDATEAPGSLGRNTVPSEDENVRRFGVKGTHILPFYNKKTFEGWRKTADMVYKLQAAA